MVEDSYPWPHKPVDNNGWFTFPWSRHFQLLSSGDGFTSVTGSSVTGSNQVLDSFDISSNMPGAVFYFYYMYCLSGGTYYMRAGLLGTFWQAAGSPQTEHMQVDVPSFSSGATTDQYFTFSYSSPDMRLLTTATQTYDYKLMRLEL